MAPQFTPAEETLSKVGRWLLAIAVATLAALILWMSGCCDRLPLHGRNGLTQHAGERVA